MVRRDTIHKNRENGTNSCGFLPIFPLIIIVLTKYFFLSFSLSGWQDGLVSG